MKYVGNTAHRPIIKVSNIINPVSSRLLSVMNQDSAADDASTSSGPSADAVLDKTMKILEDLVLDWESKKTGESNSHGKRYTSRKEVTANPKQHHQPFWKRKMKWMPYALPRRIHKKLVVDDLYSILCKIHFYDDVDVEVLRMCLLEERRDIPIACSVQAARPPTPDGELDELSEYFTHFVRVELKMSSLAESIPLSSVSPGRSCSEHCSTF
ncbi:unnamed protein product [Cylicocyclus nassatus]|uniref:Uncharacterized protein n=1 Tax=Cylicocyclus nassatus TaxID=53992 RepID=A0AA36DT99_CYLNA|nr:unnamed protein product [Cylicocyclus nassatus]